jgi:hypothetical protein
MRRHLSICTAVLLAAISVSSGQLPVTATDATPTMPLAKPSPASHEPRYISGFGHGDTFTLFFEDRAQDDQVYYVETTDGIDGFPPSATRTNVRDTHFCVKDWPIVVDGTKYAYRAWGALWDTPNHNFYVANDLTTWKLVNTFTIPTAAGTPGGQVYYGFHDVVCLNGTYYAWGECNIGYTLICRSDKGADDWEAFACVGGLHSLPNVGPLKLPDVGTPTGSFFELGGDRGYGKIMVPGNDAAIYVAINTAARPSQPASELEAAFINPDNWTWHDGTTQYPPPVLLQATLEHDYRECWLVPDEATDWYIIYDADFGDDGGKALGYAILSVPLPYVQVDIDIKPGSYPNTINLGSQGVIPVAILSRAGFDAATVDPDTVALAGAGVAVRGKGDRSMAHQEDANGDGMVDLVVQVRTQNLDPQQFQDGHAILTAETTDGRLIQGKDEIVIVAN